MMAERGRHMDLLAIITGSVLIVAAILGKKFHVADPATGGGFKKDKELPLWLGRLLFAVVGIVFLAYGLSKILST